MEFLSLMKMNFFKELDVLDITTLDGGVCLLYTSDAADERSSVDLGGRRIIKKKTKERIVEHRRITIYNEKLQQRRNK